MAGNPNIKKYAHLGGRPKGSANKINADLKQMILKALEVKGGVNYLADQAESNPTAFLSLLGKCMPKELNVAAKVAISNMTDAQLEEILRS